MNWDAIGAVGEIVGALAVVISVFYLAAQVRKQTAEARLAATRDLSTQYLAGLRLIASDEELSRIYLSGVQDYESLERESRLRVSLLFNDILRNMEQQYLHSRSSHAEDTHLDSLNSSAQEFISLPGVRRWWELSNHGFAREFREYLDAMIGEALKCSRESTFRSPDERAT